jgi:urease accessory protein
MTDLAQLRFLHIADSALPIGSAAHSFGLEALVATGELDVGRLEAFFTALLQETYLLEAAYSRAAHALTTAKTSTMLTEEWIALNGRLAAFKSARESRVASAMLGRRLLRLVDEVEPSHTVTLALQAAHDAGVPIFHCTAFGLVGGVLTVDVDVTAQTFVHQSVAALISACQRLLPFGQRAAARLLWRLKPAMIAVAEESRAASKDLEALGSFTPLLDVGSASHPTLATRLFIS